MERNKSPDFGLLFLCVWIIQASMTREISTAEYEGRSTNYYRVGLILPSKFMWANMTTLGQEIKRNTTFNLLLQLDGLKGVSCHSNENEYINILLDLNMCKQINLYFC